MERGVNAHLSLLHEARQIGTPQQKAKWLRNKNLVRKLREDNIDVDLLIGKKEDFPAPKWRERLLEVLHQPVGQLLLALLMLLDSAIIIGEIVLEVKMFIAEVHARELQIERLANWIVLYVQPVSSNWNPHGEPRFVVQQTNSFITFLDSMAANLTETVCYVGNASAGASEHLLSTETKGVFTDELEVAALAKEAEMEKYEAAAEALAVTSIVVLSLFVLEVLLKMIAMGPSKFFRSKLEVFDAVIIFTSFAVDLATYLNKDPNPEATVLIILLIWRIVRLVNGFLIHEKHTAEAHNHIMQKIIKLLNLETKYLKRKNHMQTRQLQEYKLLSSRFEIPVEEIERIELMRLMRLEDIFQVNHDREEGESESGSGSEVEEEQKRFPHNITVWFQHHSPSRQKPSIIKRDVEDTAFNGEKEVEKASFLRDVSTASLPADV